MHSEVKRLVEESAKFSVAERIAVAGHVLETYRSELGEEDIETLANLLLFHDLQANNKRHQTRPIYTDEQMRKKDRRFGTPVSWESDVNDDGTIRAEEITRHEEAKGRMKEKRRKRKQREGMQKKRDQTRKVIDEAMRANPDATQEEIAEIVGVTRMTVYNYTKREGM